MQVAFTALHREPGTPEIREENAWGEKDFRGCREHCGARCSSLLGHFPLGMN